MKTTTKTTLYVLCLCLIAIFLAACQGEELAATATPTKTPTPASTNTPTSTFTPAAPTDTPVPTNTAVPTETPTPEGTPTPTPRPTPVAFGRPTQNDVNTRKGPGTNYGKLGQVASADTLGIHGQSADGAWFKFCCVNGQEGWIARDFVTLSGNTAAIPVIEAPQLTAELQADAVVPGSGSPLAGYVSIGNVVPPQDNPPAGKYYGLCGLRVNRPVRDVPANRPAITGNVNPLTGEAVDPEVLQRRILVARYGNEPAVRALYGISAPDLVFEELMDDLNTTRFTTVWLAGEAPQIGPLRSFRSTTIQVAQMFDAVMASSGAVGPNQVFAYQAGIEDLDERCYGGPYFNNPTGGGYQNRVLTSTANLRAFLEKNGLDKPPTVPAFAFSDTPPAGDPGNRIVIPYPNRSFYEVEWRYDPASGRYERFYGTSRTPQVDGNNGEQVTAANVVILEVQHDKTDLVEDVVNSYSVRTYIVGKEGPATIARDGVAIKGRWRAPDKFNGIQLVDEAGNPLPLKPGNSWFQVVPANLGVTIVG